jgi:RHS repeat-associated protein
MRVWRLMCCLILAVPGLAAGQENLRPEDALIQRIIKAQPVTAGDLADFAASNPDRSSTRGARSETGSEARQLDQAHQQMLDALLPVSLSLHSGTASAAQLGKLRHAYTRLQACALLMQARIEADLKRLTEAHASSEHLARHKRFADDLLSYYAQIASLIEPVLKADQGNARTAADKAATLLAQRAERAAQPPVLRANAVPYGALTLAPRQPVTAPVVTPSYERGVEVLPGAVDSSAAEETPLDDEIIAQAVKLNNDYVRIYEFVRNRVQSEWYAGSVKGAVGTLRTLRGNDVDQASLLIALLRAAGLPARYVTGVIELNVEQLARQIGLSDTTQILNYLTRAGVAYSPVTRGGRIAAVQLAHTWVSAYVPYTNYRGAFVDASGKSWIPLDPAFKAVETRPSSGIYATLGGADKLAEAYFSDVSYTTLMPLVTKKVQDALQAAGKNGSFEEQLAQMQTQALNLSLLPNSLPYMVVAVTAESATLAENERVRLRVVVRRGSSSSDLIVLDATQAVSSASNARLSLSYMPATLEDHRITLLYGGLDSVPLYLIGLRPQLKLGGKVVAIAEQGVSPGNVLRLELTLSGPFGQQQVEQSVVAGAYHALVVGEAPTRPEGTSPQDTEHQGAGLLDGVGVRYARRWSEAETQLAALSDVRLARPVPALSLVNNDYRVEYVGGAPVNLVWQGVSLDAALRPLEAVGANAREFVSLAALQGSSLEHAIFEEQFNVKSISADKGFALARSAGVSILSFNGSVTPALAASNHSAAVKASVESLIRQGFAVDIPATQISYENWTGSVWRAQHPQTWQTGYFISGGLAGGQTAQSVWTLDFLEDALRAINGEPANRDPLAVTRLIKLGASDEKQGPVDSLLPVRLTVRATDKEGLLVKNVPVSFSISAGDAQIIGDNGVPGATAVAKTNGLGLASVAVKLGKSTAINPIYVYLKEADANATRASSIYIDASAQGSQGGVMIAEPFHAMALPGELADLKRTDTPKTSNELHASMYAGTLNIRAEDKHANPIANVEVNLDITTKKVCPSTNESAFKPGALCSGVEFVASLGACGGPSLNQKTDSDGSAYASVLLGTDVRGLNTVGVSAKGVAKRTYDFQSSDACGSQNEAVYSAWVWVGSYDLDSRSNNVTAAAPGGRFPRPFTSKLYATQWDYKVEDGRAVFQPYTSIIPVDGEATFNLAGGTIEWTKKIRAGEHEASVRVGTSPGYYPLLVGASGVQVPTVRNVNGKAVLKTDSLTVAATALRGVYAVKPVVDQFISVGAPAGQDVNRIYLDADGFSVYPLQVKYSISPATYAATRISLDVFRNGNRIGSLDSGDANSLAKEGSFYLPRSIQFDPTQNYDVQVRLNGFSDSSVLGARTALPLRQGIIRSMSERVTLYRSVDRINKRVCSQGLSLDFSLIKDADVSLYYQMLGTDGKLLGTRQPLLENARYAAGDQRYIFDVTTIGSGRFQLTLEAINAAYPAEKESREGLLISEFSLLNALPVGQTLINGVNVRDGTLTRQAPGLGLPGRGPALHFGVSYSSAGNARLSSAGSNWGHSLDLGLSIDSCGVVRVATGDSGTVSFYPEAGDKFKADRGYHGTLIANRQDNSFDFYSLDGTRYHYVFQNARVQWKIDSITDRNDNWLKFEYDLQAYPDPRLTRVSSKDGREFQFKYEEKQIERPAREGFAISPEYLLTQVSGTGGHVVQLDHDKLGNLLRHTLNGRTHTFGYKLDEAEFKDRFRLTSATDANGGTTSYVYKATAQRFTDQDGKAVVLGNPAVSLLTTPLGEKISFELDDTSWARTTVSRLGGDTVYEFNVFGAATQVSDPAGTTVFKWAEDDVLLLEKVDARGIATTYTYDAYGNTTAETLDGASNVYVYDTSGKQFARNVLVEHRDRNGSTYTYGHDGNGNLTAERKPEGVVVQHFYLGNGDRFKTLDGNGGVAQFEYNAHGVLEATINPVGGRLETKRDIRGRIIESTDGAGNRSFLSYDNQDNLVAIRKPKGYNKLFGYDANGNKTSELDENEILTTWEYNSGDLPTLMTRAGVSKSFGYDAAGNKTFETDWNGKETRYGYDGANRLTSRTEPMGKQTIYGYDGIGNLLSEKDARGNTTTHSYNGRGLRTSTLDADGNTWGYDYDANGNRTSQTDPHGRITSYVYDRLNRLVAVKQPGDRTTQFGYDDNSNKKHEIDPNGNTTAFEYDKADRLIKRTNALGGIALFDYDLANNLKLQTDEAGYLTQYEFDELNRKVLLKDPEGYVTRYTYDGLGNLLTQTEPNGNVVTHGYDDFSRRTQSTDSLGNLGAWGYDANGYLTSETDGEGNTATHTYNALNQRTSSLLPGARSLRFESDLLGNRTLAVDARGAETRYEYDALNRLSLVTHPDGGTVSYAYDKVGNKLSETDPLAHKSSYDYDALNRLKTVTDALGQTVGYTYDSTGNKTSETDKRGTSTTHTYDALNRRISTTKAGVKIELLAYDKIGNVTSNTDANGNSTVFEYDRRRLLTKTQAPLGAVTQRKLDAMGDVVESTDAEGRISRHGYDKRRRLASQTNPAGETTQFEYNLNGQRTATVRPKGGRFTQHYDAAGNLETVTDPLQRLTRYAYNKNNQRVSITDGRKNTLSLGYNAMGQRESISYPGGASERFTYDKAGLLKTHTDAKGLVISYDYDALNRETLRSYSASADGLRSISTTFDENNNPLTVTETLASGSRLTRHSYDLFDRLRSSEDPFGGKASYSYDANGNRLSLATQDARITQYNYDALNRLTSTAGPSGLLTQAYDRSGLLTSQSWGNGVAATRSYDAAGRPKRIATQLGSRVLNLTEYDYDNNGNRTLERINRPNGAQVTTYAYTHADQLAQSERRDLAGITLSAWTYDDAGNRASETVTRTAATANAVPAVTTRSYTYDARNQLTQVSQSGADGTLSTTYGYDLQGNQLNKTRAGLTTTYGYDAHDQLISVARDGTVLGNYRNNHLGLRIEKEAKDPLNAQGPPLKLRTLWDGHDAILDQNESGQVIARYDFADRAPIGLWHKQDGVQSLHADALGSIVLATDDKGASKAETLFDAWGNPIVDEGQSGNKFGYTGHQMDEESGLIYAQARYYDPETGRFLTQDPAEGDPEAPLSYNSYLYAYGNPTVYTDPTGMYSVSEFGDDLKEVGGKARRGLKRAGREASYAAGFVTGGALGATQATIDGAIEMGKIYVDNQLSLIGNREALRRNTERLKALGRALWEAKANVARVKDYINKEEAGAQREYAEGNAFTAGVVRGRVVGEAATIVIPGVDAGVTAARGLAKAAAHTAEKVGAAAARRAERLATAGTRTAEGAGVSTELSTTVKASEVVTAEKVGGPATSADVNRASGSVEPKLVDQPTFGSAGASSLTRRQLIEANVAESRWLRENSGRGFSEYAKTEQRVIEGANRGAGTLTSRGADWFEDVAKNATRNPDSDQLVLGHFAREGTSYQKVAAHYKATYFKVDDWNTVTKGLSQDEIWKINETFLTQQLKQGKQVLFSHDPLKARPGSFFEREVNFMQELGYGFKQKNQWTWEAVR